MIETDLIFVGGGNFKMGSNEGWEDEKPIHPVTLSDFYMGKYPVTKKLWMNVMGSNPSPYLKDDFPVINVSWNNVQEFIAKLNTQTGKQYRLPTEAEWEYAARGGTQSKDYKYSGSNDLDEVAWYSINSNDGPHLVGQKKPNELGLYDMSGNVWEWTHSLEKDYPYKDDDGREDEKVVGTRVLRGGSLVSRTREIRCVSRPRYNLTTLNRYIGFRLCKAPPFAK